MPVFSRPVRTVVAALCATQGVAQIVGQLPVQQQVVTDGAAAPAAGYGDATATGYADPTATGYEEVTESTTPAPSPPPVLFTIPGTPVISNTLQEATNQNLPTQPWSPVQAQGCSPRFTLPGSAPAHATDYNGAQLPDACFMGPSVSKDGKHHVFVIGDWGGVTEHSWNMTIPGPIPADHRNHIHFASHHREFVFGADDTAQLNVAAQMVKRVDKTEPDYILNVGDNFYWGGINVKCGTPPYMCKDITHQWEKGFENVYNGFGIDNKQWLGVLGNHDYGGFMFVAGWDQMISYSWMQGAPSKGRWVTPAQYWMNKVHYDDFSIDYYFVDTNVWDTWAPDADQSHNMCARTHNPAAGATCGAIGPVSIDECPKWFRRMWDAQVPWLEAGLSASTADWQIIVTHFPPEGMWGGEQWKALAAKYGIDLMITGHRHRQEVHYMGAQNPMLPTAYLVSGGGGGITSENKPTADGQDDEYGFMDLTLTKREIMVEAISHGGQIRSTTCVRQRHPGGQSDQYSWAGPSLCDGVPPGVQPLPYVAPPAPAPGVPSFLNPGVPGMPAPAMPAGGNPIQILVWKFKAALARIFR